ncbi:MAG: aminopeptidase P family protein [Oscillospiraceae bacterium]|nr:aminopeptidase P family protein [Oscillospiraceae bacterium]
MDNVKRITEALTDLEAILLISPTNRRYATGFPSTEGTVLITRNSAHFFVDSRYIEAARKAISGADVELVTNKYEWYAQVNDVLKKEKINKLAFEDGFVSCAEFNRMKEKLEPELVAENGLMTALRSVKQDFEVESLISAQRLAEKVLDRVLGIIKPGMTEKDVAAELVYGMLKLGAENVSFEPIVVTGEKSSMPHGVPGDKVIKKGDFLTMDFGCILGGYCSDMTRTVAIGKATKEMRKVYDTVLEAQLAGIAAAKGGVSGREVDKAARDVIEKAGYGEYFGHSFGHSLGLDIHEFPNATPTNDDPLPVGAVISAEPGIYLPGKFGVRIEDVIVLREDGCEDITKAPKELIIL